MLILLELVLLHVLLVLANSVLHELFDVLRRHLGRGLGAYLEDLRLCLELSMWYLLYRSNDTTLWVYLLPGCHAHVILPCVVTRALP